MAVRRIIITILLIAAGTPAAAISQADWDLLFVKGLARQGYTDLAVEQAEKLSGGNLAGKDAADKLVELAQIVLDIASAGDMPPEDQRELVDKARATLKAAVKADPEIAQQTDYRIQAVQVDQRIAAILARQLPDLEGEKREKLIEEIDKLFSKVKKDFNAIIKDGEEDLNKLLEQTSPNERDQQEKFEEELDKAYLEMTVLRLREALAYYAHLDTYGPRPDDPGREELIKVLLGKLEHVAWEGEGTSLVCYAHYYLGMVHKKNGNHEKALEAFKKAINTPKEIQVPQIAPRMHLEYADALGKSGQFMGAVKVLNKFLHNRQWSKIEENVVRAKLLKTRTYFSWALYLKKKAQDPEARQKYNEARKVCDDIDKTHPRWIGNVQQLVDEWTTKIYPGVDFRDPTILRSKARRLYAQKKYARAANAFQRAFVAIKEPDEKRIRDGWYMTMCYYHLEQYYEVAAVGDFLIQRFDPQKFALSEKVLNTVIISLGKLAEETGDPFDRELYFRYRKMLGEEKIKIVEATELKNEGKHERALRVLATIKPEAENYDDALLLIAECNDLLGDKYLRENDQRRCVQKQGEALGLYGSFVAWSAKNPTKGDAAIERRRNLEARALFKIGRLLTGSRKKPTIESYYANAISRTRTAAKLPGLITSAAKAMAQPAPKKKPAARAEAAAMLEEVVRTANARYLELSTGIAKKYEKAVQILPYLHYLRIIAALRLEKLDAAEADLLACEAFPEFGERIPAGTIYGKVAGLFDAKARRLEKEKGAQSAKQPHAKAVRYYLKMIEADPDQDISMLHYVIQLVHTHGDKEQRPLLLEMITGFLEKFGTHSDDRKTQQKIDHVRLMHARLLLETEDLTDAVTIYARLAEKMDKDYQQRRATNPRAARTSLHWEAKLGLARGKKALQKYDEGAVAFENIRNSVPPRGNTWWMATYELTDCMYGLKAYEKCIKKIRSLVGLYSKLGGPASRANFLKLLQKIVKNADGKAKEDALKLLKEIKAENKEPR